MDPKQEVCLSAPDVLRYLDGELPSGRKAELDQHLDECRLCEAAVEGVRGLEWREGFLKSTDSLRARIHARTATAVTAKAGAWRSAARFRSALRSAPQYLTLAAALVLGVAATIHLSRPGPEEALFQRHFEPYPSTRPVVRGASAGGPSTGLILYEEGDYRGALAALENDLKREPSDPVALFYAGLSRLALGQAREATLDLEQVRQLGENDLRAPAEWYLALAHLRSHDLAAARARLERMAESGGFYQEKARKVLAELQRLDRGQ
jgi:tetratricopeptide (TPR) repeat protein